TTVWHGRGGKLRLLDTVRYPNSLGLFYGQFTGYLGFERLQAEWKVMGLAPYGPPGVDLSQFIQVQAGGYRVAARRLLTSENGDVFAGIAHRLRPGGRPAGAPAPRHRPLASAGH